MPTIDKNLEGELQSFKNMLKNSGILVFHVSASQKYPYKFISGDLSHFEIEEDYLEKNSNSLLNLFISSNLNKDDYTINDAIKRNNSKFVFETKLKTTISEYKWVEVRGQPLKDQNNNSDGYSVIILDISRRKLADANLKYKMNFTNILLDSLPNPVYYKKTNGVILGINTAFEKLLNINRNNVIGKKIEDLISKESLEKYHLEDDTILINKKTQIFEDRIKFPDGELHDVIISRSPFLNPNLTVGGIIIVINDISELKKAEKALKASEANYKRLISYLPEIVIVYSNGLIIFANEACERKLGYFSGEIINESIYMLIEKNYHQIVTEKIRLRNLGNHVEDYKIELVKKNGDKLSVMVRGTQIHFLDKKANIVVLIDITEREKNEAEIRNSELQFRALWENSLDGMRLVDENGKTILVNNSYCKIVGKTKEELEGHLFTEIYKADKQNEMLSKFLLRIKDKSIETHLKRKIDFWNGKSIWLEFSNSIVNIPNRANLILSVFRDISEIVEIENQLSLSQKMESVGLLAAGIAHEINTPMQYIGDNTSFLKDCFSTLQNYTAALDKMLIGEKRENEITETESSLQEMKNTYDIDFLLDEIPIAIEQTQIGIERVNKIVLALKDFAHPSSKEKSFSDINHGIEVTVTISKNQWKYVADLKTNLQQDLPLVNCVLDEINQVILNIIINAAHAIHEKLGDEPTEKGLIYIETKSTGNYAEIKIEDNGTGIKEENITKIFNPFFTTKEVGKGTGQGLAIGHDIIVNKHKGFIDVTSEYGKGTVFTIKLPL